MHISFTEFNEQPDIESLINVPISISDGINEQKTFARSQVLFPHCIEFLLAGGIQHWKIQAIATMVYNGS